jgi:8-oxo-dGTP pyrophosphatase MutT (NUDIX family)
MTKQKPKQTSAGIVITDGDHMLLGHVTNAHHWDLPKGRMDPGETALQAAVRECAEETGLQVPAPELHVLGMYDYTPKKDLWLFCWPQIHMPDVTQLKCKSMFTGDKGVQPELDAFKLVAWSDLNSYCAPHMFRVLTICEKKVKQIVQSHAK